jgi:hypothetical protein
MSAHLFKLASDFVRQASDVGAFVDEYIAAWKSERDAGLLAEDEADLGEALSTIFCMADMFNPLPDRQEYEFDELRLREEIARTLQAVAIARS